MPRQLELLGRSGLKVQPQANRSEPRLWIRRLVIWSEPGVILREIRLRPGLNIIWAPDPADRIDVSEQNAILGHGSGKTLFCRLLRYCLGEDRFAPNEQRDKISQAFPKGEVGAEIIVDGTQWAVVRSTGMDRQQCAVRDADLDAVAIDVERSGIEPFLEAVTTSILSEDVAALVSSDDSLHAWPIALAWLARDQECRFDKPLDWRSPDSDSGSPARNLSSPQRLGALRALIGAIVPEEYRLRTEIETLESQRNQTDQEATQRRREADRLRGRLTSELGPRQDDLPPGRMAVEPLRRAALDLARSAVVDPGDLSDIEGLRSEVERTQGHRVGLDQKMAVVNAQIPEIEVLLSRIRGELPGVSVRVDKAEHIVCPICEVPVDRALAEGCNLSHKLPDFDEAKRRIAELKQDQARESYRLQESRSERSRIVQELEPARKDEASATERLRAAERGRDARSDAWFKARLLIDEVNRLNQLHDEQEQMQSRVNALDDEIQEKREQASAFRDAHTDVFNRLSGFFDATLRELIGTDAVGTVSLDGKGLRLSVELGGERSTAALDSLKVIAFDLAAMCMSIEGRAHQPAFLIHDSPREADLGLSIFHRLFHLVHSMEGIGDRPQFQYILTTTTSPPDELRHEPWLAETLGGAAEERLLKCDL